jgi:hypothetical protein
MGAPDRRIRTSLARHLALVVSRIPVSFFLSEARFPH